MPSVVAGLLAEQLFLLDAEAVPHALSSAPDAPRAWARELWNRWPIPHEGAVAGRLYATLLRKRLLGFSKGAAAATPLPAWRALGASWRAARR